MRIGLFTDTYRPSINGIVFVVESLKRELEKLGHDVYVFCPGKPIRASKKAEYAELYEEDDRVIRFPSVKGVFFDDYDTSIFFPPRVESQINELELDVVHIFTPSQVGLMGIRTAVRSDTPFVVQHCTDLYEFVEHYPSVLPGVLALISIAFPFSIKLAGHDIREIIKLYRPRRGVTRWNQEIIERSITILYSKADAVIALSRKSAEQLKSWQHNDNYQYDLTLMPNGVDALKKPIKTAVKEFRANWDIDEDDEVFGFVGRLGEEKNLPILIKTLGKVLKSRPKAKLLFVGDFEYRQTLEAMATDTTYSDRIVFTGAMPREELGVVYAAMDVFTFPSLKDTQGWVLHEAAHAGLPIVLIDKKVSEVVEHETSGLYARNNPTNLAKQIIKLLEDDELRQQFGKRSQELARKFTEKSQVKKLEKLYKDIID